MDSHPFTRDFLASLKAMEFPKLWVRDDRLLSRDPAVPKWPFAGNLHVRTSSSRRSSYQTRPNCYPLVHATSHVIRRSPSHGRRVSGYLIFRLRFGTLPTLGIHRGEGKKPKVSQAKACTPLEVQKPVIGYPAADHVEFIPVPCFLLPDFSSSSPFQDL